MHPSITSELARITIDDRITAARRAARPHLPRRARLGERLRVLVQVVATEQSRGDLEGLALGPNGR